MTGMGIGGRCARAAVRAAAVAGAALALAGAARAADLTRYLPPPGAGYVTEEVRLRVTGQVSLAGTVSLPGRGVLANGRTRRYAAVLVLGDASREDRDGAAEGDSSATAFRPLRDVADTLADRGLAVLRLDDRGVGASTGPDSTTASDRVDDAMAAVALLRRRGDVDPRRIAVVGLGEGAVTAAQLAAADPAVRAIVLLAPPPPPLAAAAPALVLQGDADTVVPRDAADAWVRALREAGADATMTRFPRLGHDFVAAADRGAPVVAAVVRGVVADWLAARLGGAIEVAAPKPRPHAAPKRRHHRRR